MKIYYSDEELGETAIYAMKLFQQFSIWTEINLFKQVFFKAHILHVLLYQYITRWYSIAHKQTLSHISWKPSAVNIHAYFHKYPLPDEKLPSLCRRKQNCQRWRRHHRRHSAVHIHEYVDFLFIWFQIVTSPTNQIPSSPWLRLLKPL
jgi:hypothetical protein